MSSTGSEAAKNARNATQPPGRDASGGVGIVVHRRQRLLEDNSRRRAILQGNGRYGQALP